MIALYFTGALLQKISRTQMEPLVACSSPERKYNTFLLSSTVHFQISYSAHFFLCSVTRKIIKTRNQCCRWFSFMRDVFNYSAELIKKLHRAESTINFLRKEVKMLPAFVSMLQLAWIIFQTVAEHVETFTQCKI